MKSDYNKPARSGWGRAYERGWLRAMRGKEICKKCAALKTRGCVCTNCYNKENDNA